MENRRICLNNLDRNELNFECQQWAFSSGKCDHLDTRFNSNLNRISRFCSTLF